ncbi:MAG TPA: GAF domain-containing protein [Chryseolinea sp.]|nr:GAF domain-containing protein [Chryseolinea sp.]
MELISTKKFPFKSVLSLKLLIDYWEEAIKNGEVVVGAVELQERLKNAPELREPITDLSILKKHHDLLQHLMGAVIPKAARDTERMAAMLPFQFLPFFETSAFQATLNTALFDETVTTNFPDNHMELGKTAKACIMILQKVYGVNMNFEKPILFTIHDKKTGLDKVFKVAINGRFCEIITRVPPKPIEKNVINFLLEKIYDLDLWMQYIRPEDFEFRGFMVTQLIDVTEQEMLSSIKYDLLEKNAVIRKETFSSIQQKLRSLFEVPGLRLGLGFLDPTNNLVLSGEEGQNWKSLAEGTGGCVLCNDYGGSIYERSWLDKRTINIENLGEYQNPAKVEQALLDSGIKNLLLAPLVDDNITIGVLELATGSPGAINPTNAYRVEHVLPMFTAAVKRVKEEMYTEVRALIQEECTAIHPSVTWRFLEAGMNLMNRRRLDEKTALEEIVFKDVYPLFGLSDVRNSSSERNHAIQQDLLDNLRFAKDLLLKVHSLKKLPVVEEVISKGDEQMRKLSRGLASGDENNVLEFLKFEIAPLLEHFQGEPALAQHMADYQAALDPVYGVVYQRRKTFEDSLGKINNMIGEYLDEAEGRAQEMFPHYFEKFRTDGVEFTLYVGNSLVKEKKFDAFYLKNFHLWQLMTMIEIDHRMDALKPTLKNALDITQLILVHDQPISVRFRPDEKRFDVDGAYDIRYEIVKKRIDKANIKSTGERLTQPGKIAIVYYTSKVADEYKRYFQYLAGRNLILPTFEDVELEELPGVSGLRALRIQIVKSNKYEVEEHVNLLKDIEEVLRVN